MNKSDIITYVLVIFIIFLSFKIYEESDYFNLKCVISKKDGHKYCVRNRENLESSASLLEVVTQKCQKMVDILYEKYPKQERVIRLKNGFNPQRINEILPNSQYTAYSENKGEKLAFCLDTEKNSNGRLIDINTLMYVALHELSHVASKSIGHTDEFWDNFKFLITESKEIGIYNPVDYKNNNTKYCGMNITDNPYYDH